MGRILNSEQFYWDIIWNSGEPHKAIINKTLFFLFHHSIPAGILFYDEQ